MRARRPLLLVLTGILSSFLVAVLVWCGGLLYWHLRISELLRTVREEVRTVPEERWNYYSGFDETGSRAFPYLLAELRRALLDKDRMLALRMCRELSNNSRDIQPEPQSTHHVPTAGHLAGKVALQGMQISLNECEDWWTWKQRHFPPWWMWWSGAWRD